TTTPAVGQPVTFTATLTGRQVAYGDVFRSNLLGALYPSVRGLTMQNTSTGGSFIFLGTNNIEYNQAEIILQTGVNYQYVYTNVTPLVTDKSLIYSNGGANAYFVRENILPR
ncbi:MAG: hypothetical protein ACXVI7_11505, partial [Halobacteriota archaeon]